MKVLCKECKFAEKLSDPNAVGHITLFCHFNPPFPTVGQSQMGSPIIGGILPPVTPNQWCSKGEKDVKLS